MPPADRLALSSGHGVTTPRDVPGDYSRAHGFLGRDRNADVLPRQQQSARLDGKSVDSKEIQRSLDLAVHVVVIPMCA